MGWLFCPLAGARDGPASETHPARIIVVAKTREVIWDRRGFCANPSCASTAVARISCRRWLHNPDTRGQDEPENSGRVTSRALEFVQTTYGGPFRAGSAVRGGVYERRSEPSWRLDPGNARQRAPSLRGSGTGRGPKAAADIH